MIEAEWMIGGPKDGQRVSVDGLNMLQVPSKPKYMSPPALVQAPTVEVVLYHRHRYRFGNDLIAVWICESYQHDATADLFGLVFAQRIVEQLPKWLCVQRKEDGRNIRRRVAGLLWLAADDFNTELANIIMRHEIMPR